MTKMLELGDVLEERNRLIEIDDGEEYRCAGVRLNGKGAFIREQKAGIEIKKKHVQHQLRTNDVVYSTLFANKGAFAVADSSVHGAILSEKFPTFELVDDRLLLEYLSWFFKTGQLQRVAAEQVTGMASFSLSHLSKKKFLKLKIPVPSLDRQERVIRTCSNTSSVVRACLPSLERSMQIGSALLISCIDKHLEGIPAKRMEELGGYVSRNTTIEPDREYKQVTVAMNNNGLRLRRICKGIEIRSPGQCVVQKGDLLFSRIDLRNGAIGFVPDKLEGAVVTRDFPVFSFSVDTSRKYLEYVFRSKQFKSQAVEKSRGTTGRKKLKREDFLRFFIPWPSIIAQQQIVTSIAKVEREIQNSIHSWKQQHQCAALMEVAVARTLFGADAGLDVGDCGGSTTPTGDGRADALVVGAAN